MLAPLPGGARRRRRLPGDLRLGGRRRRPSARRRRPAAAAIRRAGGAGLGASRRPVLGEGPLPRALPARRPARPRRDGRDAGDRDQWSDLFGLYEAVRGALRDGARRAGRRRSSGATSRTCTRAAARCTSRSWPARSAATEVEQWARPSGRGLRRDRRRGRHDHPPPRASARDHAPWLPAEVGALGVAALRAVKAELDPAGIMNPGKLLA